MMNVYRGCMMGLLIVFIGIVSLLLGLTFGLFGLLLPPLVIGFAYLLIDTLIVELIWWDRDHNS